MTDRGNVLQLPGAGRVVDIGHFNYLVAGHAAELFIRNLATQRKLGRCEPEWRESSTCR
jgi:hypothetical protein